MRDVVKLVGNCKHTNLYADELLICSLSFFTIMTKVWLQFM